MLPLIAARGNVLRDIEFARWTGSPPTARAGLADTRPVAQAVGIGPVLRLQPPTRPAGNERRPSMKRTGEGIPNTDRSFA